MKGVVPADFRALFEASPTPLLVIAPPNWTIVAANEARLQVTGTTCEQQIGRRLFDVFPDDPANPDADGVRNLTASLERVVATQAADTMAVQRYSLQGSDGQFVERWWAPTNTPVLSEGGKVALIIHHVEDVTEVVRLRSDAEGREQVARAQQAVIDRMRASEAAQRDAEERYLALFNAIDQGFCTIEVAFDEQDNPLDYRFLEISPSFERQTGIENGVGRWMREIAPDQDQHWFDTYGDVALTGEPARFENYSTPLNRWFDVYAFRISGPHRLGILFRDITDHKRAQVHLRESEARQAFLLKLGDALRAEPGAEAITNRALRLLMEQMRLDRCYNGIYRLAEDIGDFPHQVHDDRLPPLPDQVRLSDFPEALQVAFDRTLVIDDVVKAEGLSNRDRASFDGIGQRALIAATLRKGENNPLWAVVAASTRPRVWTQDEVSLVEEVAERTWAAVERARAQAALRESEARFRLMADAVPQIVWITDRQGRMEFLNRQFVEYTGAAGEAWTATEVATTFMHPDDGAKVVAAFEAALATGEPFEIEHRIHSAAGEDRWFLARAEPYRDPNTSQIVRWFGASVDIHDRKLAEARLRDLNATLEERVAERTAERNMLATLVETTDVMIMAVDLNYNILATNAANAHEFERVYGVRPNAGDNMLELLAHQPEHQEQVRNGWARGLRGEQVTFVQDFGDPDRSRPYYEIKLRPLMNEAGERVGAYQFVTDVTDRLREQNRLREAEEALRQSQKMEAIGQLTGGVAHDFNNLLTPIIGSLDMLVRKGVGSERERRLIDGGLQSAERAKTLVQRLLAFARRQPLRPSAVDLVRLVSGMADLIASTSGPNVDVRVDLSEGLPPAKADPNQLEMALLNLAVNARDAMPDGGVLTISAACESVRAGHPSQLRIGHYVRLSVSDTGVGMDDATLARSIEPFFSTKGIGKGTGLGLSMVHGLALQLGGAITIDSRVGEGTTVELWLPLSAVAIEDGESPTVDIPVRRGFGTALLVDDEDLVRMSTADMLANFGYEVVEAASGEQALRLLDEGLRPDLLVTDHLMPGMNGLDLAQAMKARQPTTPVLIVSGYAEAEGIAPDFPRLTKPFRSAELAAELSALAL